MAACAKRGFGEYAPESTSLADFQEQAQSEVREDRFHDVALWRDVLAHLSHTCDVFSDIFMDSDAIAEAGRSTLAAASFVLLLSSEQRERAIDELVSTLKSAPLLTRRGRAVRATLRTGSSDGLTERCGDDSQIIDALYDCVLGDPNIVAVLSRHGFPPTRCGLRTMAAVSRSACDHGLRVSAALGGLWHASPHPGCVCCSPNGHPKNRPCHLTSADPPRRCALPRPPFSPH